MTGIRVHRLRKILYGFDTMMQEVRTLHHFGDINDEFRNEFIMLRHKVEDYIEVEYDRAHSSTAAN